MKTTEEILLTYHPYSRKGSEDLYDKTLVKLAMREYAMFVIEHLANEVEKQRYDCHCGEGYCNGITSDTLKEFIDKLH